VPGSVRCERHRKVIFTEEDDAEEALFRIRHKPGSWPRGGKRPRRSYWDEDCRCWHLTSQPASAYR
jgi:hypothetical protein